MADGISPNRSHVEYWDSEAVEANELIERVARAMSADPSKVRALIEEIRTKARDAFERGTLEFHDPGSFARIGYDPGDALWGMQIRASAFAGFANEHGLPFVVRPHGSGPTHWTLERAAQSLGDQLKRHQSAVETLTKQFEEAARRGELRVRHPHNREIRISKGSAKLASVCHYYELVTRDDVNEWLQRDSAGCTWEQPQAPPDPPIALIPDKSLSGPRQRAADWKAEGLRIAQRIYRRDRDADLHPNKTDLSREIAKQLRTLGFQTARNQPPDEESVRKHVLPKNLPELLNSTAPPAMPATSESANSRQPASQ